MVLRHTSTQHQPRECVDWLSQQTCHARRNDRGVVRRPRVAVTRPLRQDEPMAIRQFSLGPMRGLVHAEAHALGNLVVIAGPNGAGKSTLLDLLKANRHLFEPGTTVMFVGPHRTWRSSQLNRVAVYDYQLPSYGAALESDSLPQYRYQIPPGMQGLQGLPRQSSSADDVQAFVKTSLIRLRDKRQALIADAYAAQGGQVLSGSVPDLFQPFQELISLLLPHLEWVGVSDTNPENIQALFKPRGSNQNGFDIDELSSGEKAAIALLLPLVERQADQLITATHQDNNLVPLTMILDEPEIHLHPLLQLQVLEYMRKLARENTAQFILSTHSPTLLDALDDDELFLLSPSSISPENQLSQLTTGHERLEVARSITGSTHVLTRAKPILFIEGESERAGVSADSRLISMLFPQTKSWALVPARSKNSVIEAVARLREEALELPGTPVFGLVDADRDDQVASDHVIAWPVAMIENLLLDAEAIYEALKPFGAQTSAISVHVVGESLNRILNHRSEDEVRLRIKQLLPVGRLEADPLALQSTAGLADVQSAKWVKKVEALATAGLEAKARDQVRSIVEAGTQSERFHGKRVLHALFEELGVATAGLSKSAFALSIAAQDAARARAQRLGEPALMRIELFFPPTLPAAIRRLSSSPDAEEVAQRSDEALLAWREGQASAEGRERLREDVFSVARTLGEQERTELGRLASQIGTQ